MTAFKTSRQTRSGSGYTKALGESFPLIQQAEQIGASGIVYTLILTALGFTQTDLLVGPMHWLIQTAHVVIGFGALVLVQVISVRDARLRRSAVTVPVARVTAPRAVR
jgi:hypothetical protein